MTGVQTCALPILDLIARLAAPRLSEQLGKPVVVDNRAGAGGVIAAELIAHAAPDGYTLSMIYTSYTTNAVLRAKPGYSPERDNTPITQATTSPLLLAAHSNLPVKSVGELLALAKSRPLLYGSAGSGSTDAGTDGARNGKVMRRAHCFGVITSRPP